MANSFFPPQIGFQPTGVNGVAGTSQLFFGRTVSGEFPYDGPGFGAGGRPDFLQNLTINLASGPNNQIASIVLNIADLEALALSQIVYMKFKEVDVCDNGVAKKMIVLASDTY
jgi:hypothetical protein